MITILGERITKAEMYERAWRLGYRGDFSLVDKIYHPEYSATEGRIITQKTISEELNHDPGKGQDWKWEDYE